MSDTYAWPPHSPGAAEVMRDFAALRDRLRDLAFEYPVDDPRRAAINAALLKVEYAEWQVQRSIAVPAPVRVVASAAVPAVGEPREVGVNTRHKIQHFTSNRGPQ